MPRMAGVMLKQESGDREHWQRQETCFNHMMPIDFWMDCLQWTNNSLPDNVAVFSEHEHWICLSVPYARTLHPMGRIKDLWRTRDDGYVPPFRMRERFGLARDRFIIGRDS